MSEKSKTSDKKSFIKKTGSFFKEVRVEAFKRVIWPTPSQLLNNTVIVLLSVLIVGALIWILDSVLLEFIKLFLKNAA